MRSNQHISKRALCPYYHKHDANKVFCEGYEDIARIQPYFTESETKVRHMRKYCEGNWAKCPVARIHELEDEDD